MDSEGIDGRPESERWLMLLGGERGDSTVRVGPSWGDDRRFIDIGLA